MDILDIAVRLGAATLVGVLLGLNRDLHGKSTGVRTLGLVCLGSALAVLSIHAATGAEESRVIQGIVTGVGFLGAGVIFRSEKDSTSLGKGMVSDLPGVHDRRRLRRDRR
jgi:putative Mg2+ transporter-C (MgtC) family protein